MPSTFNRSRRGQSSDGPYIAIHDFTDAASTSMSMPLGSVCLWNPTTSRYDTLPSYAAPDASRWPVAVPMWSDGTNMNAASNAAPLPTMGFAKDQAAGAVSNFTSGHSNAALLTIGTNANPLHVVQVDQAGGCRRTFSTSDTFDAETPNKQRGETLLFPLVGGGNFAHPRIVQMPQGDTSFDSLVVAIAQPNGGYGSFPTVVTDGGSAIPNDTAIQIGFWSAGASTYKHVTDTVGLPVTLAANAAAIAKAEDAASADADVGVPAMAVRNPTPANTSNTDGDYEMLQMSAGRLWTSTVIDTALPEGTNAIGKLAANSGVIIGAVEIAATQTLATVTTVSQNSDVRQATAANLNAQVVGDVAHDGVDAGNPVKIGGRAATSLPTAVANADRVQAACDVHGHQLVRIGNQTVGAWATSHGPAANTQATITQSAAGSGLRNVCTSITGSIAATSTAPAATQLYLYLRDGASGSGTIIWRTAISLPATAGATAAFAITNLWIVGTANTAMTLEFSAAGGANTVETVALTGIVVAN